MSAKPAPFATVELTWVGGVPTAVLSSGDAGDVAGWLEAVRVRGGCVQHIAPERTAEAVEKAAMWLADYGRTGARAERVLQAIPEDLRDETLEKATQIRRDRLAEFERRNREWTPK